jgi:Raf kinase inhibitor-like YbhB/YbcL family protein
MKLTSPAYRDGETIPVRFAAVDVTGGTGVSIPLSWEDPPPATRSFVLALIDIHPIAAGWVHWLITDIPSETRGLPEGASRPFGIPFPAIESSNSGGRRGYGGPRPPAGSGVHDYVANLYALNVAHLEVGTNASWEYVRAAMTRHVLENAALVGRFGR